MNYSAYKVSLLTVLAILFNLQLSFGQCGNLYIAAAFDGPLAGGTPKGVQLCASGDIADLSLYGIGSANNGGGTDGVEFPFPPDALLAGECVWVGNEIAQFTSYFGFAPCYNTGALSINGDDAVELFCDPAGDPTNAGVVEDLFGDINTDGTGQCWEHLDGYAVNNTTTPNNGVFDCANYTFSGIDALDGCTTNASCANQIPNAIPCPGAPTGCDISNVAIAGPGCSGSDFLFTISFLPLNASGNYNIVDVTNGVTLATATSSPVTVLIPGNTSTASIDVNVVDAADASCAGTAVSLQLSDCSVTTGGCGGDFYIAGIIDGPLTGGTPKAIQLCATADIPDLSVFGLESVTNGSGSSGVEEFTFPADAISAGDCVWVANDNLGMALYFGFPQCYSNGVMSVNGDDALVLYCNGVISDVFGDPNTDGSGQTWEYLDSWAVSNDTSPSPIFNDADWTYGGANALDGCSDNATCASQYPNTSFACTAPACGSLTYTAVAQCVDQFGANADENEFYILVDITDIGATPSLQISDGTNVTAGITNPSTILMGPFAHSGVGNAIIEIIVSDELTGVCSDTTEVVETLCWDGDGDASYGDEGTACSCGIAPPGVAFAQAAPGSFTSGGTSGTTQLYVIVDQASGAVIADTNGDTFNFTGLFNGLPNGTFDIYAVNVDDIDFGNLTAGITVGTDWLTYINGFSGCNAVCGPGTVTVDCTCCPTMAALVGGDTYCEGSAFDLSATGLTEMAQGFNLDTDFGIEFVYFTTTPTDPYSGGTSLGTVPYSSLSNADTEALLSGASISAPGGGTFEVFAILSPVPTDPNCRPSISAPLTISDPQVTAALDIETCESEGPTTFVNGTDFTINPIEGQCPTCVNDEGMFTMSPDGAYFSDSGSGIAFDFDASTAGPGTYTVTYTYTDDFGCSNSAVGTIEVLGTIVVNSTAPADLCTAVGAFNLIDFVDEPGGIFTGTGISNAALGTFDPSFSGVGVFNFVYTINDPSVCADPLLISINVVDDCLAVGIPTASEWGLLCLALSLLSFITIYVRRREEIVAFN